jgi:drug/metabolite transporter (DMT)-like permease
MVNSSRKQQTSLILWSLVWALAFIASAYIFKGNPVKDWVQSGLFIGAITYLLWKSPRTSHVR